MILPLRSFILWFIVAITFSGCTPVLSVDIQPNATVIQVTATPFPTATTQPATLTPLPSPTVTSTPLVTPLPLAQDTTFVFIGETIPDGTNFKPGQSFQKTWTIKNGGSITWGKSFVLVRTSSTPANETLGSLEHISLPEEAKPGETIQIRVDLVAPKQNGQYTVFYQLQDGTGLPVPNSQIWVTITVGNIPLPGSGGVTAQLLTASMENAEFTVDFCMQLPDERQWYPWNVILFANQQQYSPSGSRIDPVGATTANKCFSFSFPVSISSGTTFQLSLGKVELPPEVHQAENCAYAQTTLRATYPGLDFKCAGPGSWYTNLVLPSGMTKEQADQLILDAMSSSIYGPWILNGIAP
ncbi:MAG: hypothetical protein E4G99_02750 [Anaerolineales bacterium]|nr:MAG: hypothetical protein E4G99_02750 [Anaerolineales bacterium]